jgi:pilus assembly protein FimV
VDATGNRTSLRRPSREITRENAMVQVRKLVLAIAAASSLGSGMAQALGLGEVTLQSSLNQPLVAEIELLDTRGLEEAEVRPALASPEAFNQAGVDRQYFLTDLRFTPVVRPDGRSVIRVTSTKPVREPYLNFLVEVAWPSGRLMREFTLLLDPPLYSPQTAAAAPQAPAVATRPQSAQAPRPVAPVSPSAPERAAAPANTVAAAASSNSGEYRVGPRETLWEIAERNRAGGSVHQAMLAIQDLNPDAFIDGNINRMKSGQILRLPDDHQIRSRSQSEALTQVAAQNAAWRRGAAVASGERQIDARRREAAAPVGTQRDTEDNLRLLSGESGDASRGADGADGREKALADKLAVTQESLDTTRRENEELNSRLNDLQGQLDKLQRLMQLKDDQLAKLQAGLAASAEAPPADSEQIESAVEPAQDTNAPDAVGDMASPVQGLSQEPPMVDSGSEVEAQGTPDIAESSPIEGDIGQPEDGTAGLPAVEGVSPTDNDAVEGEATSPEVGADVAPLAGSEDVAPPADAVPDLEPAESEPDGMIESLLNNSMLMGIAGGAALLLLLAALILARRKREAEMSDSSALTDETNYSPGTFEGLVPADEAVSSARDATDKKPEGTDVLGEADIYIAYGRFNQAAELLLTAIDQEPHRTDLRLKLMEVYAELGDRDGFGRQEAELREIGGAASDIDQLKLRYPAMSAMAIIGGAGAAAVYAANAADPVDAPQPMEQPDSLGLSDADLDFDFSDLEAELSADVPQNKFPERDIVLDSAFTQESTAPVTETVTEPVFSLEDDLSDFSLDLDEPETSPAQNQQRRADDEFLLEDALLGQLSDAESASAGGTVRDDGPLPSDFDLSLAEDDTTPAGEIDFAAELERVSAELGDLSHELEQSHTEPATSLADEDALDDEFDFLAGTDEATTKLDLARAYIEMGDNEGAQDILEEVLSEGNETQQQEARDLIKKLV